MTVSFWALVERQAPVQALLVLLVSLAGPAASLFWVLLEPSSLELELHAAAPALLRVRAAMALAEPVP